MLWHRDISMIVIKENNFDTLQNNNYRREDKVEPRNAILKHFGAHDSRTTRKFQNFGFRPQEFKREFSPQPQVPWVGPVSS